MTDLDNAVKRIQDAVAAETSIDQSILTLVTSQAQQIKDLAAQLASGQTDVPAAVAALNAFADTMTTNAGSLSAAVTANTPAAPAPEPTA